MLLIRADRPRLEPPHDSSWFEHAACRDADRRLFFEPEGESVRLRERRVRAAKAVCAECPVRHECLLFALATPERYGIWGGLTARERSTLKLRRPARPGGRGDRRGP